MNADQAWRGARTRACRVRTHANTFLPGAGSVHTSVNAARTSACATIRVHLLWTDYGQNTTFFVFNNVLMPERENEQRRARRHGDILSSMESVTHGWAID